MKGITKDLSSRSLFDQFSCVHDRERVTDSSHHAKVMGDVKDTGVKILFQILNQIENSGFNRNVKGRGWLIHD